MSQDKFFVRCRAIIVHEGSLLVVKHTNNHFFALPGGHLEQGENVEDALTREMVEELGIKPQIGRLLYIHNYLEGDSFHSIELFFEILNSDEYRKNIGKFETSHGQEIEKIIWITPEDEYEVLPHEILEDFRNNQLFSDKTRYIRI